jgi:hypothetical protein
MKRIPIRVPKRTPSGTPNRVFKESYMRENIIKPKIAFPSQLLNKVDRLAKKAGMEPQ